MGGCVELMVLITELVFQLDIRPKALLSDSLCSRVNNLPNARVISQNECRLGHSPSQEHQPYLPDSTETILDIMHTKLSRGIVSGMSFGLNVAETP